MHCLICFNTLHEDTTWATLFESKEEIVCESCNEKFERLDLEKHHCQRCMKPISHEVNLCGDCVAWRERMGIDPLSRNISIYSYNEDMKDLMARFKYRGDYELVKVWEQEVTQIYQHYFAGNDFTIVPIPLSEERLSERGFNQAEAIAQLIGPTQSLLIRKHSEKQSKKTKLERMRTSNPFRSKIRNAPRHILLVDDIYTTGTTLRQAGQVLLNSGAQQIFSLTLIRS
ncbi:ComF family protein [Filobacillus milosensis]|uniref:ComF family protein n=1 Tax=Filobacillus milosensis TaxID=94137 RepID=A0A4Y8IXY1_9BACI|nr:ComF family protein [Filobacillus milosensis]TFB24384.1 ComF family protein [Filobacillus milosensis]